MLGPLEADDYISFKFILNMMESIRQFYRQSRLYNAFVRITHARNYPDHVINNL